MEVLGIEIPLTAQLLFISIGVLLFFAIADAVVNRGKKQSKTVDKMTTWKSTAGIATFIIVFLALGALDYYIEQPGNAIVKYLYQKDYTKYEDATEVAHYLLLIIAFITIGAFTAGAGLASFASNQDKTMLVSIFMAAFVGILIGYMFGPLVTDFLNGIFPVNEQFAMISHTGWRFTLLN